MAAIATLINDNIQNWASFFRISFSFVKRKNPIAKMFADILSSIQNFLLSKQRLKALKHRVQVMNYRIYTMHQTIQQSNPNNFQGGSNLNQIR